MLSDKWPIICRSNCSNTATIGPPVSSSDTFADCVWSLNEARSTCLGVGSLGRLAGRRLLSRGHSLLVTAALLLWGGSRPALPALPAGHDGAVGSVCWSHDSRWVLSASQDGTLRVWSVRRPEPLLRLVTGVPGHGRRAGGGPAQLLLQQPGVEPGGQHSVFTRQCDTWHAQHTCAHVHTYAHTHS